MRKIIYTNSNGGISIDTPVRCIGDENLTDEEIEQRAWDRCLTYASDPHWISVADLPIEKMKLARKTGSLSDWNSSLRIALNLEKAKKR